MGLGEVIRKDMFSFSSDSLDKIQSLTTWAPEDIQQLILMMIESIIQLSARDKGDNIQEMAIIIVLCGAIYASYDIKLSETKKDRYIVGAKLGKMTLLSLLRQIIQATQTKMSEEERKQFILNTVAGIVISIEANVIRDDIVSDLVEVCYRVATEKPEIGSVEYDIRSDVAILRYLYSPAVSDKSIMDWVSELDENMGIIFDLTAFIGPKKMMNDIIRLLGEKRRLAIVTPYQHMLSHCTILIEDSPTLLENVFITSSLLQAIVNINNNKNK